MKLMHTKLPEFLTKMKVAASKSSKEIKMRGLENLTSAKMQSLRTGRIEHAVEEMAEREGIKSIDFVVVPRVPETMHTVVIKGLDEDGNVKSVILELVNIIHPTEEVEFLGCDDVEDRRPAIGRH